VYASPPQHFNAVHTYGGNYNYCHTWVPLLTIAEMLTGGAWFS